MSTPILNTKPTNIKYLDGSEFHNTNSDWYKPPICSEYAACLHNKWGYPTKIEGEAIIKRSKFYDSKKDMETSVYNYIFKYFGDRYKNEKEGLVKQYIKLRTDVIDKKEIASILWGADINNIDREISKYTNVSNIEINLMANTICQRLIEEYIKSENVDALCKISLETNE